MADEQPTPPFSMAEGAVGVHEMFMSYVTAGFTEQQALYLVAKILQAGVMKGTPPE